MAEIAGALQKTEDQQFYTEKAQLVKNSIIQHFFDQQRGVFTDGITSDHASLHANMFPLAFGIIPHGHAGTFADHIKSWGMACSVYG